MSRNRLRLIHDTFQVTLKKKSSGVRLGDLGGANDLQGHPSRSNDWGTSGSKYFAHYEHNEERRHLVASTGVVW